MAIRILFKCQRKELIMANKNTQIAHDILPLVGGKENVTQAVNCMTRL